MVSTTVKKQNQTRDAEATKSRILDAAELEFARGGLMGARTECIAANTGVTKSMIFYYFSDKDGLYRAVLERAVAQRTQILQGLDLDNIEPVAALRAIAETFYDHTAVNHHLPFIFLLEAVQNKGKYYGEVAVVSLYDPISKVLRRGIEAGVFRQCDPKHVAVNIIGLLTFYFVSRENIKHLWSATENLLSPEMLEAHRKESVEQVVASVLVK